MEAVTIYCLKSGALLAAFFMAYYLFLRKETFFSMNRWYLLAGLVTSVALPFVQFRKIVYIEPEIAPVENALDAISTDASSLPVTVFKTIAEIPVQAEPFNWMALLTVTYCIIASLLLLKLTAEFFQLKKLLKGKDAAATQGLKFYDVPEKITPFSYFGSIVFNSSLYTPEELENILRHERVHSAQWHSIDVLLSRIFCIIFWWNPISWLYHKAILQNLEFIADSEASRQLADKRSYQYTLLKITIPVNGNGVIGNHFFQSLIKKRIVMLNTNQSSKWNSWKYLLILPVLAAFLLSFQVKTISLEKPLKALTGTVLSMDELEIRIDRNTSDEELKEFVNQAKSNDIRLKINKVKRNSYGEIIGIKVEFKDKYGKTGTTQVAGDQPIQTIYFFRDSNGLAGFGNRSDKQTNPSEIANVEAKDSEDVDYAFDIPEVPEVPETPEMQEAAEAPEPPETPEIGWIKAPSDKNKVMIITTKDGKTRKVILNGQDYLTFNSDKILADIDAADISEISILSDQYLNNVKIQADAFNISDLSKVTKFNSKQIKKAVKMAEEELKRAQPELDKASDEIKRAMEESRIEIERAVKESAHGNRSSRNRAEMDEARAEQREEVAKVRAEMAKAREEMIQAKNEMDKARAELEAERAKKK